MQQGQINFPYEESVVRDFSKYLATERDLVIAFKSRVRLK